MTLNLKKLIKRARNIRDGAVIFTLLLDDVWPDGLRGLRFRKNDFVQFEWSGKWSECSMFQLFVCCVCRWCHITEIFFVSLGRRNEIDKFTLLSDFKVASCQLKRRNVSGYGIANRAKHQIGKNWRVFVWKRSFLMQKNIIYYFRFR